MAGGAGDSPPGVDLMESEVDGHNSFGERFNVTGLGHTPSIVRLIIDFEVIGKRCDGNTCLDKTRQIPSAAPALHLIVFRT